MKKQLLIVSALMLLAFSFSSCSNSNDELVQQKDYTANTVEETEFVNLQNQIVDLNSTTFSPSAQTRGLGKWFRKIIGVVVADAAGAFVGSKYGLVGSAVGAVSASACAALLTNDVDFTINGKPVMNSKNLALSNVVINSDTSASAKPTRLASAFLTPNAMTLNDDSIGYYHNKVLIDMNNNNQLTAENGIQALNKEICISTCKELRYEVSDEEVDRIINSKEIVSLTGNLPIFFSEYENLDKYINTLKTEYPEYSSKFSILREFMRGLSNMDVYENDGNYAQKVIDLINNSNIDEESKSELRRAVIVGNASYQLWNVE